jgi:hypothetical protein
VLGQNSSLSISGGTGNYYISSNSNSPIVTTSISGNTVSFSGTGVGSSVITVCSTSGGLCGTTTVTVTTYGTGEISFNPSTLNMAINQPGNVQINGGTGPYTVSIISGNNIYYSFSGNVLTLTGTTLGTRLLNVCASSSICKQLTVTVTDSSTNTLTLNPSSLSLAAGQLGYLQIQGGVAPYSVSSVGGNTLSTSIVGSVLTISGSISGATTLSVCASNGSCTSLMVTTGGWPVISNQVFSFPLDINQSLTISLLGGNNSSYYIQSGVSSPVLATIYNNMLTVTGRSYGSSVVTACQNSSACVSFTFTVNQTGEPATGGPYTFNNDLWYGATNAEVVELQKYLIGENYLSSTARGYFGPLTLAAVRKFQEEKYISTTGYVGPLTRGALNK